MKKTVAVIGLVVVLFAALMVLHPADAKATCSGSGIVVRALTYPAITYAYVKPYATASYYYLATTTDSELSAAVVAAANSGQYMRFSGDAASCPTTGTSRSAGVLSYLYHY